MIEKINPSWVIPRLTVADLGYKEEVWLGVLRVTSYSIPYEGNFLRWLFAGELSGRKTVYDWIAKPVWKSSMSKMLVVRSA